MTENINNFELNKGDNFIFAIDVSYSMGASDCPGGLKRCDYLKEKVTQFVNEAGKYDDDGIDIITFGAEVHVTQGLTPAKAGELVGLCKAAEGATMTHLAINEAYNLHKTGNNGGRYEQTVLFIATDGAPSEPQAVIDAIVAVTKDIKDAKEFSIGILTVGKIEPNLRVFLDDLDDNLESKYGAAHDIVDVKNLDDVDFTQAFVGAVHD